MGVLIFWMSANTGSTINEGLGIISSIKALLADAALALFGHAVDVSPVGHFVEYFFLAFCSATPCVFLFRYRAQYFLRSFWVAPMA